ncbi:MAG TPA: SMP-30/gluconolactonase/LRE family protein [Vicinamibacteria bacterium]|nr:SMP-30/gluconolactonase/LRE family protein [Vicinamibacteria bacterium]
MSSHARTTAALAVSVAVSVALAAPPYRTIGRVERKDPRLDVLVPPGAVIEVLAEGFVWSEGPVWDQAHGRLLFSDVRSNVAHAWSEKDGASVFLRPSGTTEPERPDLREPGSNGLTFDAKGRLVMCQHGNRQVARLEDGKFVTLADRFEGKRFNSPNDLVYARDGALYFTDPPYGLPKTFDDPGREIGWNGVYRLSPDGRLTVLIKDLKAPNGIGLSPDGKILYVGQSDPDRPVVMAYDLHADGTVANGRVFFDATPLRQMGPGVPDGMKVDAAGNVFTTGPGGVLVLTAKGEYLGTIVTGEPTANCGFGDADRSTLYITANHTLCRVRTKTRGLVPY